MGKKREYAIGDEVQINGLTLMCVEQLEADSCEECVFYGGQLNKELCCHTKIGDCEHNFRTDNKDVIFKLKEE